MLLVRLGLCTMMIAGLAGFSGSAADPQRVLIFSHSTGYRHASIETAVAALQAMGRRRGFDVVTSADPRSFSTDGLKDIDAIVLVSTTTKPDDPSSEWLTGSRRAALQAFVRGGGGVVGIHAAADSHYHWPWYGRMIGGRFQSHPEGTPTGVVSVAAAEHPATQGLPRRQVRADEWYYFADHNPTTDLLATLDPQSIGAEDVNPNPVAWAHAFEGGRVFYTAMGHTPESYAEPWFVQHLEQGVDWALRRPVNAPTGTP